MNKIQKFPCPNCGANAIRSYFLEQDAVSSGYSRQQVMHTECPVCDYLMTTYYLSGHVLEAYGGNNALLEQKFKIFTSNSRAKSA